jgi:hypothetical protein
LLAIYISLLKLSPIEKKLLGYNYNYIFFLFLIFLIYMYIYHFLKFLDIHYLFSIELDDFFFNYYYPLKNHISLSIFLLASKNFFFFNFIVKSISVHKKVDANSPNIFFLFFYLTISVHFLWTLILLSYFIFKYFYIGVLASTIVDANSLVILYIYDY